MRTFPISDEEISYDDMVSILSNRKSNDTELKPETNEQPMQLAKPEPDSDTRVVKQDNPLIQDELSSRLSENANQPLPAWLLNH